MPSPAAGAGAAAKAAKAAAAPSEPAKPVTPPTAEPKKPAGSGFKKEYEPFRQALLLKRKSLIGDMAAIRDAVMGNSQQDASGDLSKMPIDMADVGSDNYEREFNISLIEGDQTILAEIEEALQRMEAGAYGVCSNPECGKEIAKARLEIKPYAKLCIECQRKQEKGLL
jgi:RNA polymerase-binding protein DksA